MRGEHLLLDIRKFLDSTEEEKLSPWACLSRHAIRMKEAAMMRLNCNKNKYSCETVNLSFTLSG